MVFLSFLSPCAPVCSLTATRNRNHRCAWVCLRETAHISNIGSQPVNPSLSPTFPPVMIGERHGTEARTSDPPFPVRRGEAGVRIIFRIFSFLLSSPSRDAASSSPTESQSWNETRSLRPSHLQNDGTQPVAVARAHRSNHIQTCIVKDKRPPGPLRARQQP